MLDSYWAPSAALPATLTLELARATTFDRVVLQEAIALGQRVGAFIVEADTTEGWQRIATGTTIGHKRIIPVPLTTATAIRLTIVESRDAPAIARIALARTVSPSS